MSVGVLYAKVTINGVVAVTAVDVVIGSCEAVMDGFARIVIPVSVCFAEVLWSVIHPLPFFSVNGRHPPVGVDMGSFPGGIAITVDRVVAPLAVKKISASAAVNEIG